MSEIDAATDPARLIDGEDPRTTHAADARHWIVVYGELLAYKDMVLARTRKAAAGMDADAATEIEQTDLVILRRERNRVRRRLAFWRRRLRELGEQSGFDEHTRQIQHHGVSVRLSRREAELFAYLDSHPGASFRPEELAAEAWRTPRLSAPQVRNYVVRLRRKLTETGVPCDLISDPGNGYRLKWRAGRARNGHGKG
jgi:DNA-binding response OmpR family regulator